MISLPLKNLWHLGSKVEPGASEEGEETKNTEFGYLLGFLEGVCEVSGRCLGVVWRVSEGSLPAFFVLIS